MHTELENRSVLVIGRSGGIAGAIVSAVRASGATVVVASRNRDALADAYGEEVTVESVDVTDEASVAALAERLGRVDHVVSTASARARGRLSDLQPAAVLRSLSTKVLGPILLAKHLAPRMPQDGSFVFFSGATARKPVPGMLAVAATNGGVDAVTQALAVELAPLRVNSVSPGTIDSGAYDALGEQQKADLFASRAARNPAGRVGHPDDVVRAVLYALSSTFTTGTTLAVDGGETLV
ncbi:SDR family oxidoreductase [Micromonospora sp. WMMC250]|uniref:SDR family oxidoreductase n=1 Tax=Micromonospora sp. WMMC250 TaxID=3014781 RepID=UPI0022B68D22|nr:SDR family oxidoreductase [Micromonospora sp. WMMC250]MCZ7373362.1 SDR family oxidoreductase [Micromonospora sp. WMMC250]